MKSSIPQADQSAPNQPEQFVESTPDFAISHHGTVSLLHPLTDLANDWLRLHCPRDDQHQYLGNALAIEHRFVSEIVKLASADGLLLARRI